MEVGRLQTGLVDIECRIRIVFFSEDIGGGGGIRG
jgi:hypothetical protein